VCQTIFGHVKDTSKFNVELKNLKDTLKAMDNHLNGKQWLVGNQVTLADLICGCTLQTSFQTCLDKGFRNAHKNLAAWFERFSALPQVIRAAGTIQSCVKMIQPAGLKDAAPAK